MGLNSPSSEMNTGAVSENFGWDPIVSLSQSENFGASSMAANGVYANADPSFPVHYSSDPNAVEMVPRAPLFGGGSYSEMANPFGLPVCGQNYQMLEERALMASPNGKRKRASETPPSNPNKTAECDQRRDLSGETSDLKGSDEKRRKAEKNNSPNQSNKQTGKQAKDDAQDGEESKGDYVHMRARRGQATNSHSLAERVRREKISERMRLLQELVPGCNKITGKAVMLDEIINYVQSLQQQVEFLSMKLATVNPEVNLDIDRILSKDILHLRGGGTPVLGFNPGTGSSHPYASGIHQGSMPGISNTSAYHHTLPQGMWDGEMQGLLHMGFGLNPSVTHPGSDGSSKPEP